MVLRLEAEVGARVFRAVLMVAKVEMLTLAVTASQSEEMAETVAYRGDLF